MAGIRIGVLGAARIAPQAIVKPAASSPDATVVAVAARDRAKAEAFAKEHEIPHVHDSYAALLADPEVDAIYVATPPGAHLEGALLAAAAGKPAYIEKPFARNTTECEAILAAFRAAGAPVFAAYYRRCLPRFVQVADLLAAGALGRLAGVSARFACPSPALNPDGSAPWRLDAANAGGGLFLDLASHTLDLLDHLLGPLEGVAGHAANLDSPLPVENTVAMSFRTRDGAPGVGSWNFASAIRDDEITLAGTVGRLSFSTFGNDPLRLETRDGTQTFDRPNPAHVQQPLIQTVVDALLGRGACPSTGESATRTSIAMDTVLDAYYGGRADAFWGRPATWPGRRA